MVTGHLANTLRLALVCHQPINRSPTNPRTQEDLSECIPSTFLQQSYGDHFEKFAQPLFEYCCVLSALSGTLDLASGLEGAMTICNRRQEGLRKGLVGSGTVCT